MKVNSLSRFMRIPMGFAILAALVSPAIAQAEHQCSVLSPKNRVALVELYTSEGCSSCPPADKWLSALSESGLSTKQVLPLAMHVDYWDYIGWKDRFADPRYTKRQRNHAVNNRLRNIYTPQVVTAGKDTRDWYRARSFLSRVSAINQEQASISIELSASAGEVTGAPLQVSIAVAPVAGADDLPERSQVHLMVYEDSLSTEVSRGENAGELLTHDRVVRAWARPQSLTEPLTTSADFERSVELPGDVDLANMGVAAFVENGKGEIVQATECRLRQSS
ncbi:MAG: DUF1223 domain-containing protein [Burkholderiaceae bacterium]